MSRPPTGPIRLRTQTAREIAASYCLQAPDGTVVSFRAERRSDAANAKMHAMLSEIAKQVPWCGAMLSTEDWKRIATAMLKKDRFVRDVAEDGQPGNGLIVVGARTREMSGSEVAAIIEWLEWFGAQHNVTFKAPEALGFFQKEQA